MLVVAGRKPTVEDKEFLHVLRNASDPVLSTEEIRSAVGFSTSSGVTDRLKPLQDQGFVNSKKIGPNYAWWLTDAGRARLDDLDD